MGVFSPFVGASIRVLSRIARDEIDRVSASVIRSEPSAFAAIILYFLDINDNMLRHKCASTNETSKGNAKIDVGFDKR